MTGWLTRLVDDRGDLRPVRLMRALLGVVVVLHFWPAATADGTPVERFHQPWWSWVPVPSAGGYRTLVWVGVACGLAMALGLVARVATGLAAALIAWTMAVDIASFGHNRAFLTWLLAGLALMPVARGGPAEGWRWPVHLLRGVVSLVYLTSGLTKWADADWRSGQVLFARVRWYRDEIPFGGWLFDLVTSRGFYSVAAPVVLATEVAIGLGLWSRRTRPAAIVLAVLFHLSIEVTASVQTFSWSAITALLLWVDRWPFGRPSARPEVGAG